MLFNMIFILHGWATMKHDETWWNAMKQAKSLKRMKQVVSSFGPFLGFSYLCSIKTNCSHYGEDRFSMPLRIVCHPVRLLFQGGAVGQDGAHQEGWQWPSQASPRLLLDSLEEDEVAAGEWRHKTGWWFPLPAKDFGTASLPPALVHSARWYLMRLYDTNAQLSGWTVKEVYKSQVFDVKNKTIHYLCTWTKATDMVIARRVKDKLSSTPAGVVLTTRDFGQESFPTLHTKRYPLSSISSVAWDNWSRIWRDEMYRKVVEMYCY